MSDNNMLYEINNQVMRYCCSLLWDFSNSEAIKFLHDSGLTDATIKKFDLGYSGEDGSGIIPLLKSLGYSEKEYIAAGITYYVETGEIIDLFHNTVIFPVKNKEGKVKGFVGRRLKPNPPLIFFTHSPMITRIFKSWQSVFGEDCAYHSKANYYILCQGCINTLMINQAGFDMAINALSIDEDRPYEELYLDVNRDILLAFDSTYWGNKARDRAYKSLQSLGHKVGIIDISPHIDPAEFINVEGVDAFKERVLKAKSSISRL